MKWMYKQTLAFFLLLSPIVCYSQYDSPINYNWVYGRNGGLHFPNGNSPVIFTTSINSNEAAAAVSDASGNLLFYTDGSTIWDRNHNVMPNGDTLCIVDPNGRPGIPLHRVTYSSIQGALIIAAPDNRYYVFSVTHGIMSDLNNAGKLFYSVVDMSLNNGYGDVVPGQKGLLLDSMLLESMAGIRGDRGNAWVLVHSRENAAFKAFEVNCNGVLPTPVTSVTGSYIPPPPVPGFSAKGILSVAPNRRKIAMSNFTDTNGEGNLELYDFNPSTGIVSNPVSLSPWPSRYPVDTVHFFSAAFSPNSNLLYSIAVTPRVRNNYEIYQHNLDLTATEDIINSRTFIDSALQGLMRLGPDGSIYMARTTFDSIYSKICRINNPDALGLLCDFEPDVLVPYTLMNGSPVPAYFLGFGSDAVAIAPNLTDTIIQSYCLQPCFSDTTIHYPAGYQYLWSTGATTPDITIMETGTYWVLFTDGCNSYIDTYHVHRNYLPQITTTQGCSITDSVYAIARFPAGDTILYKLTWLDNDNNILKTSLVAETDSLLQPPGNYFLQVSATTSCDPLLTCERTIPFTVELSSPHEALFTIDSILCQQQAYTFQNTSTGNINTWHWDFGDGHTATQNHPEHVYTLPGKYRVTLIAASSTPCYDTFYKDVIVDTLGQVSFSTNSKELCAGENVWFYPSYTASPSILQWNLGNGNSLLEGSTGQLSHAYDREGQYSVVLTASFRACPDTSFTDTIIVYPLPVVDLGSDSVICLNASPVTIQNQYQHDEGYQYLWNTGAATSSIQVKQPGAYWLQVSNAFGCTARENITVKKDCYIDIPNAFTPNGDGINDYFYPRQLLSQGVLSFHMQVFNRWGEKVFETFHTDGRGWDGKVQGKEQPDGVYVYVIEVELDNRRQERYEGNVTLIR